MQLGLHRPILERWGTRVRNVFIHGGYGESCILRVGNNDLLKDKFWTSLAIYLTMLFFAYLIAATSKKRMLNNSLRFVSYFGLAMSNVLLALIIMLLSTIWFGDSLTGLFSKEYRGAPWDWDKLVDFISRAWLPIFILGWSATNFALQTVWALISDEYCKLYVTVAKARGLYGQRLLRRDPARHALEPIVNSLGFDHNRVFNELPIVAILLVLTRSCPLLLAALARSNDQQLAGAITFLLTASIVMLSLVTDIALAIIDPRVRRSVLRS